MKPYLPLAALLIGAVPASCLGGRRTTVPAVTSAVNQTNSTHLTTPRQPFLQCYWPNPYNLSKIQPTFIVQYRYDAWVFNLTTNSQIEEMVTQMHQKGMIRRRVLFIIHGYKASIRTKWLYEMSDSLLTVADDTVIVVGWGKGADFRIDYPQAASNTQTVSAALALVAKKIRDLGPVYLYCIGHSLGSHICGQAGTALKFDRISGLDPAGPGFYHCPRNPGLNNASAICVDVIHTNGDPYDGLGRLDPLGHIDFYPSCGRTQPGCKRFEITCSHHRAIVYFIKTISADPQMYPAATGTCGGIFDQNCKPCNDQTCPGQPTCKRWMQAVGYWSACSERRIPQCGAGQRELSYGKWFVPVTKVGFVSFCSSSG